MDEMMDEIDTREQLLERLEAFLNERRECTSDWVAEPTQEDWHELQVLFRGILRLKFEPNYEGRVPIQFTLADRHRHEHFDFLPVPHMPEPCDPEFETQYDSARRRAKINFSLATQQVERLLDAVQSHIDYQGTLDSPVSLQRSYDALRSLGFRLNEGWVHWKHPLCMTFGDEGYTLVRLDEDDEIQREGKVVNDLEDAIRILAGAMPFADGDRLEKEDGITQVMDWWDRVAPQTARSGK